MNTIKEILKWLLLVFVTVALFLIFQKKERAPDKRSQDSIATVDQATAEQRTADSISESNYQDIQFTFADSSGRFLICSGPDSLTHPPYVLVTRDGNAITLRFVEYRKESEQSSGRQTENNFSNTGGTVFFAESKRLIHHRTYLVVSSRFLSQRRPLRLIENDRFDIDTAIVHRISRTRARPIQKSWPIAILDTIGQIGVVWFKDQSAHPLASLVVAKSDSLLFEDYVGDASREGSVWRVDDNGEFTGDAINVIAGFQSPSGIELARTWGGAEGESEDLLQQSKDRFVSVRNSYRYWVPE